VSHKNKKVKYL